MALKIAIEDIEELERHVDRVARIKHDIDGLLFELNAEIRWFRTSLIDAAYAARRRDAPTLPEMRAMTEDPK